MANCVKYNGGIPFKFLSAKCKVSGCQQRHPVDVEESFGGFVVAAAERFTVSR